MFYLEKDITEELTCPKCKDKFNDPRILPCGHSLCNFCIFTSVEVKNVTCLVCSKKHSMPVDGQFFKNDFINKLLEKRSYEIKRGGKSEMLRQHLTNVNEKKKQLDKLSSFEERELELFNYISGLRVEIDRETEIRIEMINNERDKLLKELDDYSAHGLDELKRLSQRDDATNGLKDRMSLFNKEVSEYLSRPDFDEKFIELKVMEAEKMIKTSCERICEIEKEIFMNIKPSFVAYNPKSDIIKMGRISYNDTRGDGNNVTKKSTTAKKSKAEKKKQLNNETLRYTGPFQKNNEILSGDYGVCENDDDWRLMI